MKPGPESFPKPSVDSDQLHLAEMLPGMQLAHPLSTKDGRLLVEKDTILDPDIIWRIWRLASICPLNAPIIQNKS